ncbi:hypothetical protein FisN_25Lh007 [Fistulifera solaris]|uniref:Uncharacterized protein n=1 Tax=Fistulifera solaris TaxID=1519565 RepID=A0A1Z5JLK8_FISSO|nr:hypothetical protein FisN_25Lh007 [Fistulifera solaris]|eukprot:GAX14796.1 hypothetical protein FisN_25Lh007 [Fistulifera solaris]
MKINANAVQFASLDMSMTTDHDDVRSTRKLVFKSHYGSSLGKVPLRTVDRVRCRHHDVTPWLTGSDDGQNLHLGPFLSTTQSRWPVVTDHYTTYDSSSDLRAKAFESSTLLTTPIPSDLVPQNSPLRGLFTGDSRCARKPQKLLHSHSPPSLFFQSKANMAMMSPSSSTPRSRSIKIARTKRSEPDFEADVIDRNKSLYDSATWRMYNRITEYRRQHPINYDDMDAGSTGIDSIQSKSPMFLPRKESSTLYGPRALNRVLMSVGPVTPREQHKLDGEVFDMDL